jgi:hypothetical protein
MRRRPLVPSNIPAPSRGVFDDQQFHREFMPRDNDGIPSQEEDGYDDMDAFESTDPAPLDYGCLNSDEYGPRGGSP